MGVALERHYGGGQTIRAVTCIPALTGAWRHVGGGVTQFGVWEHPYKFDVICRPDLIPEGTRVVSNLQIGRALTGEMKLDPPILSMMCWNSNPVTQAPETDKIVEGLMREDLFMVSAEHFISDTASYADILLPATMGAEMEDMILSWGHLYLTYNTKCAEAPGEAIPNNEIFRRLAARLGFEEENFKWTDTECLEHYVDWSAPACEGIDLQYMREHGFARLKVGTPDDRAPHREGNFPTPTGKCMLKVEGATNFVAPPFRQMYEGFQPGEALDPLPDYLGPRESHTNDPGAGQALPAQHRLAQEPLLPELLLREHGGQAEGPGRAVRDDQPARCRCPRHPGRRPRAGRQRPRRLQGRGPHHRRREGRHRGRDAGLLASAQRGHGQQHLVGGLHRHGPRAIVLR